MDKGGGEMSAIKDAKPGERWSADAGATLWEGVIVEMAGQLFLAYLNQKKPVVLYLEECGNGWRKVANADGTPYEEPKPLPDFGECWAARDFSGLVYLSEDQPSKQETINRGIKIGHFNADESVSLGKIQFRPDLPWHETACKVRVRLEVVE
jgi:hypothetical protein